MSLAASINASKLLPLNTAVNRLVYVGVTDLTLTVTTSKDAGSFGAWAGAVTEVSGGYYKLALAAGDCDTEGDLGYIVTDGGTNVLQIIDQVAAPVKLGDKMQHGGPAGISTATIAAQQVYVKNPNGDAIHAENSTTGSALNLVSHSVGYAACNISNNGAGTADGSTYAMTIRGGGPAIVIATDSAPGTTDRDAVLIQAEAAGHAIGLYGSETASTIYIEGPYTSGPAIDITTTAGNILTGTPGGGGKFLSGTGGVDVGTITGVTIDAAGVRTAVGLATANLDTQLAEIEGETDAILTGPIDANLVAVAGSNTFGGVTLLKSVKAIMARAVGVKTGLTGGAATGVQVKLPDGTLVATFDVDANGNTSNVVFA